MHEENNYPYGEFDYQATDQGNIIRHNQATHLRPKYPKMKKKTILAIQDRGKFYRLWMILIE